MTDESIHRAERFRLYVRLLCRTARIGFGLTRSLPRTLAMLKHALSTKSDDQKYGHPANSRKVDGKYYWQINTPGFPSPAFDRILRHWVSHNLGLQPYPSLYSAHVAITKQCSLNCRHCFEWDSINQPARRTDQEILETIDRLLDLGTAQIVLSGGEPVSRFDFLIQLLNTFRDRAVQFWINTSAIGLTRERIASLKKNGLTGIIFSLDHHDSHAHDRFRGKEGCCRQVIESAKNAHEFGLVTACALCATTEYVNLQNLEAYMQLARELHLTFVQFIEPKPIGKYEGRDVSLTREQQQVLESWHDSSPLGRPLISYPDYHNRRYGCEGGRLHLYVDAEGQAHPCPFCKSKTASLKTLRPDNLDTKLLCPNLMV